MLAPRDSGRKNVKRPKRVSPQARGPQGLPTVAPRVTRPVPAAHRGPQGLPGPRQTRPTQQIQRARKQQRPRSAVPAGPPAPDARVLNARARSWVVRERRRLGLKQAPAKGRATLDLVAEVNVLKRTGVRRGSAYFGLAHPPEFYDRRTGKKLNDTGSLRHPIGWVLRDSDVKHASAVAPVLSVLEQTSRPIHAVAGATDAALKGKNVGRAALRGLQNKDKTLFSDVLKDAGAPKAVAGVAGFGLDVLADPLTYLTLGTGSAARQAAIKAARQAERAGIGQQAARVAEREAARKLVRRGVKGEDLERAVRAAGKQAKDQAVGQIVKQAVRRAEARAPGRGVAVRVAGRDVPGVTRATAAAGRGVKRVAPAPVRRAGNAVRHVAADFNPNIVPDGASRAQFEAIRQGTRTARSGASRDIYKARLRAHAINKAIGKKNYEEVLDAIEAGSVKHLPAELQKPARFLQSEFARMRKLERRAGIPVASKANYVKHVRRSYLEPDAGRKGIASVGANQVRAGFQKQRIKGTLKDKRASGEYVDDPGVAYAARATESALAKSRANLNRKLLEVGRRVRPGQEPVLRDGEALFLVKGSDIKKVTGREAREYIEGAKIRRYSEGSRQATHDEAARMRDRAKAIDKEIQSLGHKRSRIVGKHQSQGGADRAYYVGQRRFKTRELAAEFKKKNGGTIRVVATSREGAKRLGELSQIERLIKRRVQQRNKAAARARALEKELPASTRLRRGEQLVALNEQAVTRALKTVVPAGERTALGKGIDRVQGSWKWLATQPNPGFHVRNLVGDSTNAFLAQPGHKLANNLKHSRRALTELGRQEEKFRTLERVAKSPAVAKINKALDPHRKGVKINGERMKYADLVAEAEAVGGIRSGFVSRELHDLLLDNRKVKVGAKFERSRRWLNNREDLIRLATYIGARQRGLNAEQSAAYVAKYHFDYSDLTELERRTLRRVMPFYTFSARNIPLQFQSVVSKPGKFAQYQKIREEVAKAFGIDIEKAQNDSEEYEQRAAPIYIKVGGRNVAISLGPSGLPLTDLNELPTGAKPSEQAEEWLNRGMSMVTPAIKTPIELGYNLSFFFRDQIEKDTGPLVPAPKIVGLIPAKQRKELGIVPDYIDKRSGKKGWGWPAKVGYAAGVLPGPFNFLNRVMTPSERAGAGTKNKVLGYAGIRVKPLDPTTKRINEAYEERGKVQKEMRAMNQRGISVDNPTPEYKRALARSKALDDRIVRLRVKRKDAVIPGKRRRSGGPSVDAGVKDVLDSLGGSGPVIDPGVQDVLDSLK